MTNITPICQRYGKRPSQFLDNDDTKALPEYPLIKVTKGFDGGTSIPDSMMIAFYVWLDRYTRHQIFAGVDWRNINV